MYCSSCGKPIPDGASFCPSCGAAVPPPSAAPGAVPPGVGGASPGASSVAVPPVTAGAAGLYAGFWRRFWAFFIDGCILGVVMLPFGIGLWATIGTLGRATRDGAEALAAIIAASMMAWFLRVVASWLYGALFESSNWQATPGKRLLGLRVTDLGGRRITFMRATGRALAKWLSGLVLGIGFIMVAFTEKKQGLHDLLAGTVVRR